MKNKIVLTGGCGFIGSHTCVELQEAGYEVVILDNLSNSEASVVDGIERITHVRPHFYQVDCGDRDAIFHIFEQEGPIAGIIHFAASKAVGESVEKPLLYYRNNLTSLITMLEAAEKFGLKGFVFSSSCTVYGEPDPGRNPVDETAPIKPATSPYGNTKQIAEEIIRDNTTAGAHFKSIILRYFNPVGAHPSAEIGELPNGVPQNLIPYLTQTAIGIRKELSVFGDDYNTPDGSCIRDFINVVDLAKAHVIAIERMLTDKSDKKIEIFNLGTGVGLSVKELIKAFETATGVKVPHKIVGRRAGDIEKVWADPAYANNVLGWVAETPIEDTMRSAWAWQCRLRERGIM
jgi:UDP-glucose 4-epimerase